MCIWTSARANNRNITIQHHDGIFLIREQEIERLFTDNTSVNRFVVSEAILKCLKLIEAYHSDDSKLYSVNTDGIFITNPNITFKNKMDIKFSTKKLVMLMSQIRSCVILKKKNTEKT